MSSTAHKPPVTIVCVGMAGSGKTTFMQRINAYLHSENTPPYVVNLDPAVHSVPFEANIDIRDTVNYKEVMKQYNLGPNGGILTSLNLFATKVDQVLGILEKRTSPDTNTNTSTDKGKDKDSSANPTSSPPISHILVDTPGQIEVFVWSASGDILLNSLASSFPTVLAYIIDTPRAAASTSTFMSNMLYACSILYKTRLPMVLVCSKTDVRDAAFAREWMTDFEAFQAALHAEEVAGAFGNGDGEHGAGNSGVGAATAFQGSGYMASLVNSLSLVLEEFYKHLRLVEVSAMTGDGIEEFFDAVEEKRGEFEREYKVELERRRAVHEKQKEKMKDAQLDKLMKDLRVGKGKRTGSGVGVGVGPETVSEAEEEDDDDDYDDNDDRDMDGDDGLKSRYDSALRDTQGPTNEDMSFMKYLATSNMQ